MPDFPYDFAPRSMRFPATSFTVRTPFNAHCITDDGSPQNDKQDARGRAGYRRA